MIAGFFSQNARSPYAWFGQLLTKDSTFVLQVLWSTVKKHHTCFPVRSAEHMDSEETPHVFSGRNGGYEILGMTPMTVSRVFAKVARAKGSLMPDCTKN